MRKRSGTCLGRRDRGGRRGGGGRGAGEAAGAARAVRGRGQGGQGIRQGEALDAGAARAFVRVVFGGPPVQLGAGAAEWARARVGAWRRPSLTPAARQPCFEASNGQTYANPAHVQASVFPLYDLISLAADEAAEPSGGAGGGGRRGAQDQVGAPGLDGVAWRISDSSMYRAAAVRPRMCCKGSPRCPGPSHRPLFIRPVCSLAARLSPGPRH